MYGEVKMKNNALSVTSQVLGIVAQSLAIGIEIGVIAFGVSTYKRIKAPETPQVEMEEPVAVAKKTSFKQRWNKFGQIVKAVLE